MTITTGATATKRVPSDPTRRTATVAGWFFIITFVASIPAAFYFYGPVLNDPNYITGVGADTRVLWGAFLEIILAIAGIGTAVTLFSILKRQNERVALGYVATRIVESTVIVMGIISLLSVVTLRQDFAGASGTDKRHPGRYREVAGRAARLDVPPGPRPPRRPRKWTPAGLPAVQVRPRAAADGPAGACRRSPGLRLRDRRAVRSLRADLRDLGARDTPGVRLGAEPRHLPHRQGVQGFSHHSWSGGRQRSARLLRRRRLTVEDTAGPTGPAVVCPGLCTSERCFPRGAGRGASSMWVIGHALRARWRRLR
jgi:hypothetical protein